MSSDIKKVNATRSFMKATIYLKTNLYKQRKSQLLFVRVKKIMYFDVVYVVTYLNF